MPSTYADYSPLGNTRKRRVPFYQTRRSVTPIAQENAARYNRGYQAQVRQSGPIANRARAARATAEAQVDLILKPSPTPGQVATASTKTTPVARRAAATPARFTGDAAARYMTTHVGSVPATAPATRKLGLKAAGKAAGKVLGPLAVGVDLYEIGRLAVGAEQREQQFKIMRGFGESVTALGQNAVPFLQANDQAELENQRLRSAGRLQDSTSRGVATGAAHDQAVFQATLQSKLARLQPYMQSRPRFSATDLLLGG